MKCERCGGTGFVPVGMAHLPCHNCNGGWLLRLLRLEGKR